jgi:hypothetical protein
MMSRPTGSFALALAWLLASATGAAQTSFLPRLPADHLDVRPPAARIDGAAGRMTIRDAPCATVSTDAIRQRIVDVAVQEWGYFGFPVVDQTVPSAPPAFGSSGRRAGGWRRAGGPEAARVAASIAGYWAVTPGGSWILEAQNDIWREPGREDARWRTPWSAAFISWVMCEGGLGDASAFQRAIAHHTYIDQAIRAADGTAPRAAFVAHDVGVVPVAAGDLLCTSRRPAYRTLAERRRQMGEGARSHCDLVVKVDEAAGHLLTIGGNVRGVVGLKIVPVARRNGVAQPIALDDEGERRPVFAHLHLRVGDASPTAFDRSPTVGALACAGPAAAPTWRTALALAVPPAPTTCAG